MVGLHVYWLKYKCFSYILKLLSEVQYHITLCHTALTLLVADTVEVTIHQCTVYTVYATICLQVAHLAILVIFDRLFKKTKHKDKKKTETVTLLLNGIIFLCWTTTMDFKAIVINRMTKSTRERKKELSTFEQLLFII